MAADIFIGPPNEPDKYRLVEPRSEGAEGVVWRGELDLEGMTVAVAVKVINASNAADMDRWRKRWHRQAELLRSLDHPGLVSVREVFEGHAPHAKGETDTGGQTLCLVMNWVEGPTLAEWVAAKPNRDPVESLRVIASLAAAVDYLHSFGDGRSPILHRDIKPPNVIMAASGPKLVDFGFARAMDRATPMTMVTTPRFTAPEVAAGLGYSEASDRYALGATAFFALTGHAPSMDDVATMRERLDSTAGLQGRSDIHDAVLSMLSASPEDRPASSTTWAQSMAMASIVGTRTVVSQATTPTVAPQAEKVPIRESSRSQTDTAFTAKMSPKTIGIAAAVVGIVGIGIILAQSLGGNPDTAAAQSLPVPNVVGLDADGAQRTLESVGFTEIAFTEIQSSAVPGTVISMSPDPGSQQDAGVTIVLLVASQEQQPAEESTTTTTQLEPEFYCTWGEAANVRSGVGVQHPIVGTISANTGGIEATGQTGYDSDGDLWRQIHYGGALQWVSATFLTENPCTYSQPRTYFVTGIQCGPEFGLNVRAGVSYHHQGARRGQAHDVLMTLPPDYSGIAGTGYSATDTQGRVWIQVRVVGVIGWSLGQHLAVGSSSQRCPVFDS